MPYLSVVNGIPTMKEGGIPASIAPSSPAPIEYARPDDRIVLRPGQPPMVIKADVADAPSPMEEELELEVRDIDEETETVVESDDEEIYTAPTEESPAEKHDEYMNKLNDGWANGTIPTVPIFDEDSDVDSELFHKHIEDALDDQERYWGGLERSVTDVDGTVYHRHPNPLYAEYGCCFETGEIARMKPLKNEVNNKLTVNLKNGITLSLGMKNGKRQQKHYAPQKFVAEVGLDHGKIKKRSALHTELKINTRCQSYIKRPHLKLYPVDCLTFEMPGEIKDGLPNDATGTQLRARVKTADQIDAFVASIRRENEKLKNKIEAKDAEIIKLKVTVEKQAIKLRDNFNEINRLSDTHDAPLKAGAIQLQELLMTEHQGSTVWEMLQFCVKDITRGCVKENYEYERSNANADFGIFEMSPRGLPRPDENHIRQID